MREMAPKPTKTHRKPIITPIVAPKLTKLDFGIFRFLDLRSVQVEMVEMAVFGILCRLKMKEEKITY